MSHNERKALPSKRYFHGNQNKASVKSCSTVASAPHRTKKAEEDCSLPEKVKHLRTRKERDQIRGLNISSFYRSHKHSKRRSKEDSQCCDRQKLHCSHPFKRTRREKAVAVPFISQKPTVITEGRLTSIRGLFSHEVRSVDVERLVKEQRRQSQEENHEGKPSTCNSPSLLSSSPLISASGKCDIKERQKSKSPRYECISKKTDYSQTQLEGVEPSILHVRDDKYRSAQTCPDAVNNVINRSPEEAVVLSSSDCEIFQCLSTPKANQNDPNVTPEVEDVFRSLDQEQTNNTTPATNVQQRLDNTLASSVHLNSDASPFDSAPVTFNASTPVLDKEGSALSDEGQSKKPEALIKSEVMGRLASRLCQTLDFSSLRRHCPLLRECREVLMQTMQERNSVIRPTLSSAVSLHSSHITEQACSSTDQRCGGNTSIHFSFKNEDAQQSRNMEKQADDISWRDFLGEHFCKDTESRAAGGSWRRQTWASNSPQDFFTKLHSPCKDMLGKWSEREPPQVSFRAKQHPSFQSVSLHQSFNRTAVPTPYSYNCGTLTPDPFFLQPHTQAKLGTSENRLREVTELFDQWRNDPDLGYLFHENVGRTPTLVDPLTDLRVWSPHQQMGSNSEGSQFDAFSSVSSFPSEGFCYEPYYRFPHPTNSINNTKSWYDT